MIILPIKQFHFVYFSKLYFFFFAGNLQKGREKTTELNEKEREEKKTWERH